MTWRLPLIFLSILRLQQVYLTETGQSWLFLPGMIMGRSSLCMTLMCFIGLISFLGLDGCCQKLHGMSCLRSGPSLTYWDDWFRLKENHKGRQFIRPEVCRTYNFGEHGSSLGQFFRQYLEPIKLNDVQVNWRSMNLSYLVEDNYLEYFANLVKNAKPLSGADAVVKANDVDGDVRIPYLDQQEFESIARQFGVFEEWKDGIPRTAYKGVVVFRYQTSKRVFFVGPDSLKQLGVSFIALALLLLLNNTIKVGLS
ncbi:Alpha-1 3-mannosyl-glycoprotein 2-beta-N-acetylglucosaminyltransferase [Bienertia sinuspersici]